jgi:isochorismate synthase
MGKLFSYFEAALAEKKSAFAVYSKPGENIVRGIFGYEGADHEFEPAAKGFIFAPFTEGKKIYIPADESALLAESFESMEPENQVFYEPGTDGSAKNSFEALVAKSIHAINSGQFEKLVCSRPEEITVADIDAVSIFKRILKTYPNAFCYCFFSPETGLWMGATPEQLLKVKDNTFNTVALAGTQLYNAQKTAEWPEKEQQEQQFVTDYIVDKLGNLVTDVKITQPYTFRAGSVVHIKTDISGTIQHTGTLYEIIEALHPTPAVCGLPKELAQQFLTAHEGYNREYYSGYLGEINMGQGSNNTDLFVNLRCMKIKSNKVILYVGCGITKDSNPEKEFFETVNKSMTIRKVL